MPRALARFDDQCVVLPDGKVALTRLQCLKLFKDLESTKTAIVSGEFFRSETIGLVPAYDGWVCERAPGETAVDYALRSRELALAKINDSDSSGSHVVLTIIDQLDAA